MKNMSTAILLVTATSTALIAGLLYAYTCSVNIGLGHLSDEGYLSAMQSINRAILNPIFFATFIGTLLLLPITTVIHYGSAMHNRFLFLLAATVMYAIGVFGVTMLGNVPLNETLDRFDLASASSDEIARQRKSFEIPWNKLHAIRTIASIVSLIMVIMACLSRPGNEN